jgi:transposase
MFMIGIDPHKGSHVAAVLDEHEELLEEVRVRADLHQRERLLKFAAPYTPRIWAIEGARGLGALLAQQLVAAGETVVDVPAKLSARVRSLDNECVDKNDTHDARSAAIVGMHNRRLLQVAPENHAIVLRMLAKRHHDLTARRTQSICRLHAVLVTMVPGGLPRRLSAHRAATESRRLRPIEAVGVARRQAGYELLAEVRDADRQLRDLHQRITAAVRAADTTVTNVYGVGPIVAAYLIGYTGDVTRFATKARYARYNATRPWKRRRARTRGIGSTRKETGNSTTRSTSRRSLRSHTTPPDAPTTNASSPRPKAPKKRCARSNGGSATPSTRGSKPTRHAERQRGPGGQPGTTL